MGRDTVEQVTVMEVIYTWTDGREEVRYRRPIGSADAERYEAEVAALRNTHADSPYSVRYV